MMTIQHVRQAVLSATDVVTGTFASRRRVPSTHNMRGSAPLPVSVANAVTAYAVGATGNVAPIQTISGSKTNLILPTRVEVDAAGNIYVANSNEHDAPSGVFSATVFAKGANGNVAPIEMIAGRKTKLKGSYGLARDGSGGIHVTNYGIKQLDDVPRGGQREMLGRLACSREGKALCTNPSASRFSELAIPSR